MADAWGNQGEHFPWQCGYCDKPVNLAVLDRWSTFPDEDEGQYFEPFEQIAAKCVSCSAAYVLSRDLPQFSGDNTKMIQVFPEQAVRLGREVPVTIRDAHEEALKCIGARCWTAGTLMARRGVEAICAEQGETKGTLSNKLDNLRDAGTIDSRLHEWSSVVRNLGNAGAHDTAALLSREDADDAVAFFEALVNYLYTFRQRYEAHIERKNPPPAESAN